MSLAHLGLALKSLSEIAAVVKAIEALATSPKVDPAEVEALATSVAALAEKVLGKAIPVKVKGLFAAIPEVMALIEAIETLAEKHTEHETITAADAAGISKAVEGLFEKVAGFALPTA